MTNPVEVIVTREHKGKGGIHYAPGAILKVSPERAKGMIANDIALYTENQKKLFAAATVAVEKPVENTVPSSDVVEVPAVEVNTLEGDK